jgi:hypothetical protein
MPSDEIINPELTKEYFLSLGDQDHPDFIFDNYPDSITNQTNIPETIESNPNFVALISHRKKIIIGIKPHLIDEDKHCHLILA